MLNNFRKTANIQFQNVNKYYFSKHSKFVIVGGGTAGVNAAHQLMSAKLGKRDEITIFDPAKYHYYQPGFTKIGGGVITTSFVKNNFVQYDMNKVCSFVNFHNDGIANFLPEENAVQTSNGDKFTYDHLIVAAGLQVNYDGIPGLHDLVEDPTSNVCSIFNFKYAHKTHKLIENLKGGKALFTQHTAPIKCAGAPQKILYLAHDIWTSKGVKVDINFFTPLPKMFGIPYYADHLNDIATSKGINRNHQTVMTEIARDHATFKRMATGETFQTQYDFIHVSPPMMAPTFLKGQPIVDASGFVDTTTEMRHKKYSNIYAVGDCVNLPCAKTASAVFAQLPILVQNLEKDIYNKNRVDGVYQGYSACPIYTQRGKLLMAEFKTYNDENNATISKEEETFFKGNQTVPRRDFYYIAKCFTYIYYISLRRNWYGNNFFIRPFYEGVHNKRDFTYLYQYFLRGWPWATGFFMYLMLFR